MEQVSPGQMKKYLKQLKQREEQYFYYLGQLAYQAGEQGKLADPGMQEAYGVLKDIQAQTAQWETSLQQVKAAREAAQKPRCPNCGALVKGAAFCPSCGAPVAAPPAAAPAAPAPAQPTSTAPLCPSCGAPLDADAVFCGNCGANVAAGAAASAAGAPATGAAPAPQTPAPEPSAPPAPAETAQAQEEEAMPPLGETLACPNCGTTISDSDMQYCPECGTSIGYDPAKIEAAAHEHVEAPAGAEEPSEPEGAMPPLEETLACPNCGTPIRESEMLFCPDCGTKVRE